MIFLFNSSDSSSLAEDLVQALMDFVSSLRWAAKRNKTGHEKRTQQNHTQNFRAMRKMLELKDAWHFLGFRYFGPWQIYGNFWDILGVSFVVQTSGHGRKCQLQYPAECESEQKKGLPTSWHHHGTYWPSTQFKMLSGLSFFFQNVPILMTYIHKHGCFIKQPWNIFGWVDGRTLETLKSDPRAGMSLNWGKSSFLKDLHLGKSNPWSVSSFFAVRLVSWQYQQPKITTGCMGWRKDFPPSKKMVKNSTFKQWLSVESCVVDSLLSPQGIHLWV